MHIKTAYRTANATRLLLPQCLTCQMASPGCISCYEHLTCRVCNPAFVKRAGKVNAVFRLPRIGWNRVGCVDAPPTLCLPQCVTCNTAYPNCASCVSGKCKTCSSGFTLTYGQVSQRWTAGSPWPHSCRSV